MMTSSPERLHFPVKSTPSTEMFSESQSIPTGSVRVKTAEANASSKGDALLRSIVTGRISGSSRPGFTVPACEWAAILISANSSESSFLKSGQSKPI